MSPVFAPNCSPEAEEDVVALFSLVATLVRGVVATGAAADDFLAAAVAAGSSPLNCRAVVMLFEVGVVGILVGVKALVTAAAVVEAFDVEGVLVPAGMFPSTCCSAGCLLVLAILVFLLESTASCCVVEEVTAASALSAAGTGGGGGGVL